MAKEDQLVIRVDAPLRKRIERARTQVISDSQHTPTTSEVCRQLLDLGLRVWESYRERRIGQTGQHDKGIDETPT